MAKLVLNDFMDIGTKGYHTATTWQASTTPDFVDIIEEKTTYGSEAGYAHLQLPKPGGGYYADLDNLYARCKVHILDDVSEWFYMDPVNQNIQDVTITKNFEIIRETTSEAIGLQ